MIPSAKIAYSRSSNVTEHPCFRSSMANASPKVPACSCQLNGSLTCLPICLAFGIVGSQACTVLSSSQLASVRTAHPVKASAGASDCLCRSAPAQGTSRGLSVAWCKRGLGLELARHSAHLGTRDSTAFSKSRKSPGPVSLRWKSIGSPRWVCSPMVDQSASKGRPRGFFEFFVSSAFLGLWSANCHRSERAFRILCRRYGALAPAICLRFATLPGGR